MKSRLSSLVLAAVLAFSAPAFAEEGAQGFVQKEHDKLESLLKQPASATRDTQVTQALDTMVDYDELARRAFGQPCPPAVPACVNHWGALADAQQTEVKDLLKKLVEKNYRKNLIKTLDYDITYRGARDGGEIGVARIRTEAKSKLKPRDPAVQVDYVVRGVNNAYRVVDIVTEGSSLAKNYYDQFHRMLTTPTQGYAHVVKKLNEKIAKKD